MDLSEEQNRIIEENRKAALARLAKRTKVEDENAKPVESIIFKPVFNFGNNAESAQSLTEGKDSKIPAKKLMKSRLESATVVSIYQGGEALDFKGLEGVYCKAGSWHVPLTVYKQHLVKKVSDGVPENIVDMLLISRDRDTSDFQLKGSIPESLLHSLYPFQRDGVQWGLKRNGRCIIADEMGLGKSLQALAIAAYYKPEWPLLILSPASMVATWTEQVKRWLEIDEKEIAVAYDGRARLGGLVNICSYDLAVKLVDTIKANVVIADESHCLRNASTKRFKTLGPFLKKKVARLLMLSGTPALSRPIELFSQLSLIDAKMFPRQVDYGLRYCAGKRDRFGWNFRGASNLKELGIILEQTIMLRRTKAVVLHQLPRKIRQQVFIRVPDKELKELRMLQEAISANEWAALNGLEEAQRKGELMALWRRTGECKLPSMWAYIEDLLDDCSSSQGEDDDQQGRKLLIFAHHQGMLDSLQENLNKHGIRHIRIDGKTPPSQRGDLCSQFQNDRKTRVALLSITAASVGLTLTAASCVVFCELFFNPGILVQAEDRAHRIGQSDCVTVHYLLAKGTIDDRLWPLLISKLNTLEMVGLGENDFSGIAQVDRSDEKQTRIEKYFQARPESL